MLVEPKVALDLGDLGGNHFAEVNMRGPAALASKDARAAGPLMLTLYHKLQVRGWLVLQIQVSIFPPPPC